MDSMHTFRAQSESRVARWQRIGPREFVVAVSPAQPTQPQPGQPNLLGNAFNYNGPMLWTVGLIHDSEFTVSDVMTTLDATIEEIRTEPVSEADVERARTKLLADFYGTVDTSTRFGLVDLLASFALFDDDPGRINRITEGFQQVTPELIRQTAQEYLRPGNRTVLEVRLADEDGTTPEGEE